MAEANTTIWQDQYVPVELWGKDHYSTLAYIETKLVERKCSVRFDPHMRQNRRNFRVLGEKAPLTTYLNAVVMRPEHGSRLSDDTYLPWHDDWCCVQDMLAAGLFAGVPDDFDVGFGLSLTQKGHAAVAAIREHKARGGNFSTCAPAVMIAMGYMGVRG